MSRPITTDFMPDRNIYYEFIPPRHTNLVYDSNNVEETVEINDGENDIFDVRWIDGHDQEDDYEMSEDGSSDESFEPSDTEENE
ncbi:unnamed protein product [Brachionus calyciflorus]|uniref:Uncharacterized protein n=1 Tax=Brachionus calyciflorus TaxID=104777 RepID=A0A813WB87_9BILA|nr:unnamed protein product [Brachionus calyciflorus]